MPTATLSPTQCSADTGPQSCSLIPQESLGKGVRRQNFSHSGRGVCCSRKTGAESRRIWSSVGAVGSRVSLGTAKQDQGFDCP